MAEEIKGYRVLTPEERARINELKLMEASVLQLLSEIQSAGISLDMRWHHIGKTHIEQGFMAAVRAIAQPEPVRAITKE